MKHLLAVVAVLLVLPAVASARPADPPIQSGSRGDLRNADLQVPTVPRHLPARGTDVAAPDQQSPIVTTYVAPQAPVARSVPAVGGFDWGAAAIGAAGAMVLLAVATGARFGVRRTRHPSVAIG